MIKSIRLILLLLLITSCNSKEKKTFGITQNQKPIELKSSIKRGQLIYKDMCITCHLADGKGVHKVFPPLADSDYLRKNQNESIKGVKKGISGKITVNGETYNNVMTPLGLSNEEVADVLNYINNSWGNNIKNFVTPKKVSEL
jgi:mono/diheme cytochrome c family protein